MENQNISLLTKYKILNNGRDSSELFKQYARWWWLPEVTLIKWEIEKESYLKSVLNTILFKDITTRFSIKEPAYLQKILNYFADTIGSPISLRNIKNSSNEYDRNISSLTTLSTYISYLELPYLMHSVHRLDIRWKKLLEHNEKYYFNDLWMKNALRVKIEIDIWKILENIVYLHLRRLWYKVFIWSLGNKEIDFVAQKWNRLTYVQVTYLINNEKTKEREFWNLLYIKDAYPKFVVSADELAEGNHNGIQWINIYDFIMQFK